MLPDSLGMKCSKHTENNEIVVTKQINVEKSCVAILNKGEIASRVVLLLFVCVCCIHGVSETT